MNWTLTPAQQEMRHFLETPVAVALQEQQEVSRPRKPRYTDIELLAFIAARYRELKRPPKLTELNPLRGAVLHRFNSHDRAVRLAAERFLTQEEREEYVWRCRHCGRTGFRSSRGLTRHEQYCEENGGRCG